jgi:hypothetical protein
VAGRAAILALLAAILASLTIGVGAAGAANTVTVGAALPATEVQVTDGCNQPNGCAVVILDAAAPSSGTAAPFGGTVTSWQIGGASPIPGYTIAAVRPNPGGTYTVTATEAPVTPTGGGPETFSANLPIAAGEFVAIDIPYEGEISVIEGSSENAGFAGSLTLGETRSPSNVSELTAILTFAATIEERVPTPPPADTTPPPSSPPASASPSPSSPAPPAEPPHCVVPKLIGKSLKAAKRTLRRAACGVGFVIRPAVHRPAKRHRKPLKVRAESPRPGKALPVGTEVTVKLG